MADATTELERVMAIEGALGAALVDEETGIAVRQSGGGPLIGLGLACAIAAKVMRAHAQLSRDQPGLGELENQILTFGGQYHILRPVPASAGGGDRRLFLFLALDRARANVALARLMLSDAGRALVLSEADRDEISRRASRPAPVPPRRREPVVVARDPDADSDADALPPFLNDAAVKRMLGIAA